MNTSGAPTIKNNVINGNAANIGGAVAAINNPAALIEQNLIYNNSANEATGMYLSLGSGTAPPPHTASLSGTGIDFFIAANPTSASVKHGQSVKVTITVSPLGGSFSSAVALSCSGLPSGATCSFSPASVTPGERGATAVMTVSTSGKTPRGNYNIASLGKSGSDSHSTAVLLAVN
jgi:hypothetical protein